MARPLDGEGAGKRKQGTLAGGVGAGVALPGECDDRGDVDDAPAALLHHVRPEHPSAGHRGDYIELQEPLDVGGPRLEQRRYRGLSGVINEDVGTPELIADLP